MPPAGRPRSGAGLSLSSPEEWISCREAIVFRSQQALREDQPGREIRIHCSSLTFGAELGPPSIGLKRRRHRGHKPINRGADAKRTGADRTFMPTSYKACPLPF